MPLYDLTKLQFPGDDSIYHHFHASWLIALADALNRTFPEESGFEAIFEKKVNPLEADVVTIDSLAEGVRKQFIVQCRCSQLPSPAVSFINISYNVRMVAGDVRMEVYPYWLRLGETLPQVPLFLVDDLHIEVDLESTFMEAVERLPPRHRRRLCESSPNSNT